MRNNPIRAITASRNGRKTKAQFSFVLDKFRVRVAKIDIDMLEWCIAPVVVILSSHKVHSAT